MSTAPMRDNSVILLAVVPAEAGESALAVHVAAELERHSAEALRQARQPFGLD